MLRTSATLWLGAICVVTTMSACVRRGAGWRQGQELLIMQAVVEDLMELPPDPHAPTDVRPIACVFSGVDRNGWHDPSPALLARLQAKRPNTLPASACDMSSGTVAQKASGARAQLLGAHSVEWRSDDLVKVEGERIIGPAAGASWIYTLSHTPNGWVIDSAKADKIY